MVAWGPVFPRSRAPFAFGSVCETGLGWVKEGGCRVVVAAQGLGIHRAVSICDKLVVDDIMCQASHVTLGGIQHHPQIIQN